MSVDTRNGIIAIIAAGTLGALLIISLVGIVILAVVHDGELANHALDTFNQIIIVAIPAMAALAGVERVVTGITAGKALASTAAVQVAQVNNGQPTATAASTAPAVTTEQASSPAGTSPDAAAAVAADAASLVAGAGV